MTAPMCRIVAMNVTATGRQAITTKFLGPTNTRGSRVIASCDAGRVTLSWDHAFNSSQNHAIACNALLAKLGWSGEWRGGGTGSGYVFVNLGDGYAATRPATGPK